MKDEKEEKERNDKDEEREKEQRVGYQDFFFFFFYPWRVMETMFECKTREIEFIISSTGNDDNKREIKRRNKILYC